MFVLPPPPRYSPLILLRVEAATLELIMPNFHLRRRTSPPKKKEREKLPVDEAYENFVR